MNSLIEKNAGLILLVGRILLGALFLMAGLMKISGYDATAGYMETKGLPGILLPLVIATEVLGGLAVIVGFGTRIAAFLLAGFCILSGVLMHNEPGNQTEMTMMLKNITIAGGFLVLMVAGPGSISIDGRRSKG